MRCSCIRVQRQVDVVRALGVGLDEKGYVQVDEMTRETSVPGVYAAGELLTAAQAQAILSAAAGMARGGDGESRDHDGDGGRRRVRLGRGGWRSVVARAVESSSRCAARQPAGVAPCMRRNRRMKCVGSA